MTSTVAFAAQGIITLLIFLPRNLSKECGYSSEESAKQDKTFHQPLLNGGVESGCISRLSSGPITEPTGPSTTPRPPSPATSACSLSEKNKSYSPAMSPVNRSMGEALDQPYDLAEINSGRNIYRNSDLTNFQAPSTVLTKHRRDFDRSSFVPQELIQFCSPGTSQLSVENSPDSRIFCLPSTSRSPNILHSKNEFISPPLAAGSSVPFPISSRLTHFPRYFAPSERRAFESCDGGSSKSFRTMSRSLSINQTLPIPDKLASQPSERPDLIHPAISLAVGRDVKIRVHNPSSSLF
ncbi:hypothetical protein PGTUg99_026343 [Puccinia graminis f. sp. tritici]|uniref:Uncharacterized protein n=1 Tax=Puccinia graminis f. sp. tritici TaxID=56615 RepID=A0A5B0LPJ1_PUCGR|nr:hypothetical protein PGTUg99_000696 [Puccinia graminis f. sp. tritici]KAA1065488.1 hypothetical protein PGTUg99_026343 [Puccinia graminis f. sp. tritici]